MLEVVDNIEKALTGKCIVYFTASWCSPCKVIKPQFARAGTIDKNNNYYVVDVDNLDKHYLDKYGIMSVPQIIILNDGEIEKVIEARTSSEILEEVNNV